jgi:hypothetical protein
MDETDDEIKQEILQIKAIDGYLSQPELVANLNLLRGELIRRRTASTSTGNSTGKIL